MRGDDPRRVRQDRPSEDYEDAWADRALRIRRTLSNAMHRMQIVTMMAMNMVFSPCVQPRKAAAPRGREGLRQGKADATESESGEIGGKDGIAFGAGDDAAAARQGRRERDLRPLHANDAEAANHLAAVRAPGGVL